MIEAAIQSATAYISMTEYEANYVIKHSLAAAIIHFLNDPKQAKFLGESGKQKVLRKFTWPVIGQQFREVYSNVVRNSVRT
jgi:glycosyltransferase involved in cell wall biosynthesis